MELPREFLGVADPQAWAAEARRAGKIVVWVPRSVRSKEKLFGLFAAALRFPNYCGRNWDALEECLCDLSWLPADAQIALVHERFPFGESENRQIYKEILRFACRRSDGRVLQVVWPEEVHP